MCGIAGIFHCSTPKPVDASRIERMCDAIAHHGPDALPGRRFRSAEALALYRVNALDAGVKGALERGLE